MSNSTTPNPTPDDGESAVVDADTADESMTDLGTQERTSRSWRRRWSSSPEKRRPFLAGLAAGLVALGSAWAITSAVSDDHRADDHRHGAPMQMDGRPDSDDNRGAGPMDGPMESHQGPMDGGHSR